jgi:hypothetical protein
MPDGRNHARPAPPDGQDGDAAEADSFPGWNRIYALANEVTAGLQID